MFIIIITPIEAWPVLCTPCQPPVETIFYECKNRNSFDSFKEYIADFIYNEVVASIVYYNLSTAVLCTPCQPPVETIFNKCKNRNSFDSFKEYIAYFIYK